MTRYLLPLIFLGVTVWVARTNAGPGDTKVVVPFVDVIFPEAAGNPALLGERSVWLVAGATGLLFVLAVVDHARALRKPE